MLKKKVIGIICAAVTSMMLFPTVVHASAEDINMSVSGTYNIEVTGYDWGPAVNKAVITLDKEISEVNKEMFKVEEIKTWYAGEQSFDRSITDVYLSDASGNKISSASKNVTIELKVSPNEGSPFLYNIETVRNNWTPYALKISLSENQTLKSVDGEITEVNIKQEYITKSLGTVDKFKQKTYSNNGDISMSYTYYEPQEDNKKNPLIIWLHGAGEGGTDTSIVTLGNKVGALIEDNIQNKFGGAYVLAPQSPTMWMDSTGNAEYTSDGSSIYTTSLLNLIKSYVNSNSDIDTDRIYIGGCSNGGYMTMSMILQDPEYFAAAYPICEAYSDSWISDEKINSLKNMPIWFTYAKNDTVVDPLNNSAATIERLVKLGNANVHASVFDNVIDTSGLYKDENGRPYEYMGHWSWVYAFNDECKDGSESMWNWLAKQKKVSAENIEEDTSAEREETADGTEDVKPEVDNIEAGKEAIKEDEIPKTADPLTLEIVIAGLMSAGVVSKLRKK